jgi:hypothetical protein
MSLMACTFLAACLLVFLMYGIVVVSIVGSVNVGSPNDERLAEVDEE